MEHPSPEQVAAGIIKIKMERDSIEKGEQFKLSTGGNPLFITAGVSDIKTKRATLKQISFQTIMELSNVLELSKNKTKKLCTALRRNLGSTNSVESIIFEKMDSIQDKLGEFYETKTENFLHNNLQQSNNLFGIELGLNIPTILNEFKNSFSYLQKYVHDIFELNVTASWKVHIAVCHILPFIEKIKLDLATLPNRRVKLSTTSSKKHGSTINAL